MIIALWRGRGCLISCSNISTADVREVPLGGCRDLQAVALRQRVLRDVTDCHRSATTLLAKLAIPFGLGPVAMSLGCSAWQLQAARAAASRRAVRAVYSYACPIAEVGAIRPDLVSALYRQGPRLVAEMIAQRAKPASGAAAAGRSRRAGTRYRTTALVVGGAGVRVGRATSGCKPRWAWDSGAGLRTRLAIRPCSQRARCPT